MQKVMLKFLIKIPAYFSSNRSHRRNILDPHLVDISEIFYIPVVFIRDDSFYGV